MLTPLDTSDISANNVLASKIESAIKAIYSDSNFWDLMAVQSSFKAGPFDGGCLVCALAITKAFGGALTRIVDTRTDITQHYGALIAGDIYDFYGKHDNANAWVETFGTNEALEIEYLTVSHGRDAGSIIPTDEKTTNLVAKLLVTANS